MAKLEAVLSFVRWLLVKDPQFLKNDFPIPDLNNSSQSSLNVICENPITFNKKHPNLSIKILYNKTIYIYIYIMKQLFIFFSAHERPHKIQIPQQQHLKHSLYIYNEITLLLSLLKCIIFSSLFCKFRRIGFVSAISTFLILSSLNINKDCLCTIVHLTFLACDAPPT